MGLPELSGAQVSQQGSSRMQNERIVNFAGGRGKGCGVGKHADRCRNLEDNPGPTLPFYTQGT